MFILFNLMLFSLFSFFSLNASEQDDFEKDAIETMALTFQGFAREGGDSIWPNFDLTDCPVIFHFRNGHAYAYGLKLPSSRWEKLVSHHYPISFCPQFPVSLPLLQPAYPIGRERAFVMSLDQGNLGQDKNAPLLPLLTFIHERFHITQFSSFAKEKVIEPEIADYQNVDLLTWMEMEHKCLISFLQTEEMESRLEALKDYLAISHLRRRSLHSNTIKWEDHQQKMEGLADYASVKTFQVFCPTRNFNGEACLLTMRQKKNKGIVHMQDALKGRHYFVGAVMGWALDFCQVKEWKMEVEKEGVSLYTLMEKALPMSEEEREKRFLQLQMSMEFNEIRHQIEQKRGKERDEGKKIMRSFLNQKGILIHMGTPSGPMSGGGTHQKMYQIDHKKLLTQDKSKAMTEDQLWTLNFHAIPFVLEEQNGDRFFKLDSQTILLVDGREISLENIFAEERKEHLFQSLSLKHPYCELDARRGGKIVVEEKEIHFKFH